MNTLRLTFKKIQLGSCSSRIVIVSIVFFFLVSYAAPLSADVSLKETSVEVVLENANMSITINKINATVTRWVAFGKNVLDRGQTGYYFYNTTLAGKNVSGQTVKGVFKVEKQSTDLIDVAVCFEEAEGQQAFNLEIHFVVKDDTSGLYLYTVDSNSEAFVLKNSPTLDQLRYAFRVDPTLFPRFRISDQRSGVMPEPKHFEPIMDATYTLPSGEIYTKYNWITEQSNDFVYGTYGDSVGFWLIKPSSEYAGGGPLKQDLSVHHTDKGPIVLWHPLTSHYGTFSFSPTRAWRRVCGPVLWYVNQGDNDEALWKDATKKSESEKKSWPYSWVTVKEYAASSRSKVFGKLQITDGTPSEGAVVVLAKPGSDWQIQNGSFHFWSAVLSNGQFVIDSVVPGKYSLTIFAKGVLGEYHGNTIEVSSSESVDLGTVVFSPAVYGKTLWQIGVPDRTTAEFHQGGVEHHWGDFLFYPTDFPQQVDFTIGKSKENKDWNWLHPASVSLGKPLYFEGGFYIDSNTLTIRQDSKLFGQNPLGSWSPEKATPWIIRFPISEKWKGTASLTVALAGTRYGSLRVRLNGEKLVELTSFAYANDSSSPRVGSHGLYQVFRIPFDASKLVLGENQMELSHLSTVSNTHRKSVDAFSANLYDCLRLEVDAQKSFTPVDGNVIYVLPDHKYESRKETD